MAPSEKSPMSTKAGKKSAGKKPAKTRNRARKDRATGGRNPELDARTEFPRGSTITRGQIVVRVIAADKYSVAVAVVQPPSLVGNKYLARHQTRSGRHNQLAKWLQLLAVEANETDDTPTTINEPVDYVVNDLPPISEARVANAARLNALRAELVASGSLTTQELAAGKNIKPKAASTRRDRAVESHRLIKVSHEGRTLVPAFLLDEAFDPIPEWEPILKALAAHGDQGWAAWTWLATPTTWLDNRSPIEVFASDPGAVLTAVADRHAALTL